MKKMGATTNALNWFEIPMMVVERAMKFYQNIFDIELHHVGMMGMDMLMFPTQTPYPGGALVKSNLHVPSTSGSIIYLNANPDLQLILNRIEENGGKIIMQKILIDKETGYMAYFIDSEGNSVGLHSGN